MDKALFGELIENCGYCIKYMTESNLALENGDILKCQEHSKRAQDLLKSMTNDIFCEVKEILGNEEEIGRAHV